MKSLKYYIVTFTCIVYLSCTAQNPTSSKTEGSTYLLLNWILQNREEMFVSIEPVKLDIGKLSYLSNEAKFSKFDSVSIMKQIQSNNTTVFSQSQIKGKKLLTDSALAILKESGTFLYLKVSKPIFWQDKAWLIVEQYCGINCGSGNIYIYSIKKSDFKLLFEDRIWIS